MDFFVNDSLEQYKFQANTKKDIPRGIKIKLNHLKVLIWLENALKRHVGKYIHPQKLTFSLLLLFKEKTFEDKEEKRDIRNRIQLIKTIQLIDQKIL